ncbi:ArnT family glycosyltransferase [Terrilactibacillus laevilacticus]|uniref:Glycosyltransferase family 39 protein n=1 Tax=Terrilactibacillus laevilacticus TaxID=1380157 RepID=A0ABW5PUB4_9BACI|nr:glycosyltransferase family 39 protein [Terrilactibacillus laevilacticus]
MSDKSKKKIDIYLIVVMLISIFLNFFKLYEAGSNTYYTVAVKSMMKNFHNFFYGSFDPAGFITVDKPPVALWIQTLSAKIFGLSNFSVLLPEALAGVVSVYIMYRLIKPKFGRWVALLSSLTLATTPIFVAVIRTNNVDSILIVTLLFATWALMKAMDKQKLRWFILSVILIGVGFNIKMMAAFMILPAMYLFYWVAMNVNWKKKIIHLAITTVVLFAISLSWATVVDLVPKDSRPYIGSSQTNSVLELALGYNGLSRLIGQQGQSQSMMRTNSDHSQGLSSTNTQSNSSQNSSQVNGENMPRSSGQPGFQGGAQPPTGNGQFSNSNQGPGQMMRNSQRSGGMFGTGETGPLRLFSKELSGQASWLLPFTLFTVIGLIVLYRRQRRFTIQHKITLFWVTWLVPMMVFFSIAGFFHQYYLSLLGPAVAALVGIGSTILWQLYKEDRGFAGCLLPIAILFTFVFEAIVLLENRSGISITWSMMALIIGCLSFFTMMLLRKRKEVSHYVISAILLALLIAPLGWTLPSTFNHTNSSIPVAGPSSITSGGMGGAPGGQMGKLSNRMSENNMPQFNGASNETLGIAQGQNTMKFGNQTGQPRGIEGENNTELLTYLKKHYNGEKYILATVSAQSAYSIMMNSSYAVMAMGGFSGSDPAVTPAKLAKMTKTGEVKYFLISGSQRENQSTIQWITEHCKKVSNSEWKSNSSNDNNQTFSGRQSQTLYVYQG